jgi:hypothetical protein
MQKDAAIIKRLEAWKTKRRMLRQVIVIVEVFMKQRVSTCKFNAALSFKTLFESQEGGSLS